MNRLVTIIMVGLAASVLSLPSAIAQNSRVVTAAQANGIYRDSGNEFRVLALGHHKLKVQFDGTHPTITNGVSRGSAIGEATIEGNVATFFPEHTQACKITMTFLPGSLIVAQDGESFACGFGANVNAEGTYRKVHGGKPTFPNPAIENPASSLMSNAASNANAFARFSTAAHNAFDPTVYYRLTTQWQGDSKSLDIVNDQKNNNQPILAQTGNYAGQLWQIVPAGNGYYRLMTKWQGSGRSLDVVHDQKNSYLPVLADTGNYAGQLWKIIALGNGYYRLTTEWFGLSKSLDVVNDGRNDNQLVMADTANYSGQFWKITRVQ